MVDKNSLMVIAKEAGQLILSIYRQAAFSVVEKQDCSPLTQADIVSHQFICDALQQQYPAVPILSEESSDHRDYAIRQRWEQCFLVDPLDGTKEFIKRNDQFTVNIAFIHQGQSVIGVVYAPALDVLYYAEKGQGAYKQTGQQVQLLPCHLPLDNKTIRVVASRSHACAKTQAFIGDLQQSFEKVEVVSVGSALKFGLLAEGAVDVYPRFSPTMEWDTAAGHVLVNEVGMRVLQLDGQSELTYNKPDLVNPGFIVR